MEFPSAKSPATYARYIRVGKKMIRNEGVLPLLVSPAMEAAVAKAQGITDLDDPALYIPTEVDFLLMIQAADRFVKNDHKPALFHAIAFFRHARASLDKLDALHMEQDEESFPSFALLLETRIQQRRTI